MFNNNTISLKVVLIGKTNVGKTSILNQFIYKKYNMHTDSTIGAAFFTKEYRFLYSINDFQLYKLDSDKKDKKEITIKLEIWDTAGQEKYNSLVQMYYRDAHIIYFVHEANNQLITDPNNYTNDIITRLDSNIFACINKNAVKYIIYNKCDLLEYDIYNRQLSNPNKYNIITRYVSAYKNKNIENIFIDAIIDYLNNNLKNLLKLRNNNNLINITDKQKESKCC